MSSMIGSPIQIPGLAGELTGGDAIVIERFGDLAALQQLCATAETLYTLGEVLRVREVRPLFPDLRANWRTESVQYRAEMEARLDLLRNAEASGDLDDWTDHIDPIDQLRLGLDLAEAVWKREGDEFGISDEDDSLNLVLAVAEPGGELELSSEEPALIFSPGSMLSIITRPGGELLHFGAWMVGLFRGKGVATTTIASQLVEEFRASRIKECASKNAASRVLSRLDAPELRYDKSKSLILFLHGLLSTDVGTFDGFITEFERCEPQIFEKVTILSWPHDTLTGIENNAHDLAELIAGLRLPDESKIVFVCHSRGGLVARETALRLYEVDSCYRRMIRGCLTFGTPHNGAELAQFPFKEFLGYFVTIGAANEARNLWRLNDLFVYRKQQPSGIIQGIADLRPPEANGFIPNLRNKELHDVEKTSGRVRELRLFTVGSEHKNPKGAVAALARRFFGKNEKHDLVVNLKSSRLTSADGHATVDCSHSDYCSDRMVRSKALVPAVQCVAGWISEP